MRDGATIFEDPGFQAMLKKRSRLRWGFSISLIGAYIGYGIIGLQIPDAYATSFFGSSMPWGMALGFILIGSSIVMSVLYVRIINRLEADNDFVTRHRE
ncbi:MAG: DUF485 domain-containing protein [Woeseiales bacterium]